MKGTRRAYTLIFEHIPKTAGSTMHGIMGRQYRNANVFRTASTGQEHMASVRAFKALSQEQRERLDLLSGHCVLALEHLIPQPKRYIAFLRDPYQQFKSGYYFIRRAHWNQHHEAVQKMKGLSEYLDYRLEHGLDNMQTRYLSGVLAAVVPAGLGIRVGMAVDESVYKKASTWLGRLDHVGITEEFDASILMMKEGLGWERHCHYQVQNRTVDRPDPTLEDGLEDRFREAYRWDLQLYMDAKTRFQRDLSLQGPGFSGRLWRFRMVNKVVQRIYPLLPGGS